jgi:mannosyltransferase
VILTGSQMATREQRLPGAQVRAAPLPAVLEFVSSHALALIVALAALLRFATLGVPSYWLDEYVSLSETHGSLSSVLNSVNHAEGGPPLYLLLLWGWRKVFGDGEIAIRSMSALFGTATVPVAFAAARELASRRAGLFAAALAATSPLLIWYSQDIRTYAVLVFLSALSFMFFVYALERQEPRWIWGWAIFSGLAFTTHYFAAVLIAPEAAWLLLRGPRVRTLLACAGIGAAGVAVLLLAGIDAQQNKVAGVIRQLDRVDRIVAIPQHFIVGLSVPWRILPVLVGALLVAVVIYALRRADLLSLDAFAVAGGVALAGFLLAVVPAFLGADYVITRYVLELWLPFAVAVAVALAVRSIGGIGIAAVVALCVAGVALSTWNAATPAARRVNWDTVASALGTPHAQRVVVGPGYFVSIGLSLYLPDAHLATSRERIVTRNLVLLSLRPVPNYAIGACFWGADCGGDGLGGSGPPIKAPPRFKLVRSGATPRVIYRVYRSPKPIRIPSPKTGQIVIVQDPA